MAVPVTTSQRLLPHRNRTAPRRQSSLRDSSFTSIEIRRRSGAQRIIQLPAPLSGYLLWLNGRENPELPIMILASFLASTPPAAGLLPWTNDQEVIRHLHIPLRGFAEFVYGEFIEHGLYGEYFRPCQPKDAKHLLLRVRWSAKSEIYRRHRKLNTTRHKVKYFAKTTPDARGMGYDFIIVPVWHQSDYNPAEHAAHTSFVKEATERHQQQWNAKTQPPQNNQKPDVRPRRRPNKPAQARSTPRQRPRSSQPVKKRQPPQSSRRPVRPTPPAQSPKMSQAEMLTRLDELRRRAWNLYCGDYKKLRLHVRDQSFSFLGRGYACTERALQLTECALSQYEADARRRAGVYRELLGLKTQFALKGHQLLLDVWAGPPEHQTLMLQLDEQFYEYSEQTLEELRKVLQTIT